MHVLKGPHIGGGGGLHEGAFKCWLLVAMSVRCTATATATVAAAAAAAATCVTRRAAFIAILVLISSLGFTLGSNFHNRNFLRG